MAVVSVAFTLKLILKKNTCSGNAPRDALPQALGVDQASRLNSMDQNGKEKPQVVADDYCQPFPSDDSININSVLSWKLTSTNSLVVNFHNSFLFDSARSAIRSERVQAAIHKLRKLSSIPLA